MPNLLTVHQISERRQVHQQVQKNERIVPREVDLQVYLERAEEDLFSAIVLLRRTPSGVELLNNVCYLLHQSLEKWLKIYLTVNGVAFNLNTHNLLDLINLAMIHDIIFHETYCTLVAHQEMVFKKENKTSNDLRYGSDDGLDNLLYPLLRATFLTRRLVKRTLKAEAL